jgi:hypothetical protein
MLSVTVFGAVIAIYVKQKLPLENKLFLDTIFVTLFTT